MGRLIEADLGLTHADIVAARERIAENVVRTPLVPSRELTRAAGGEVRLKLECIQETGSFKLRGATNRALSMPDSDRARGVIAVSSGNHGRAVAAVASRLGVKALICLGEGVPRIKVEGIRSYGAEVLIAGATYDEAAIRAHAIEREQGMIFIHPFDDPAVIAGQGTIGLEIVEDFPGVEILVVPISGGGLIGGIALAAKSIDPDIRVIGACMERSAAMHESLRAGKIVGVGEEPSLADALAGDLGDDNRYSFRICQALVDETILVSEEEIAAAMAFMLRTHGVVVEGGGAVCVAALRAGRVPRGRRVAAVVSGRNIEPSKFLEIVRNDMPESTTP
ncbi:MAG: pyridoxal-phosphate dependent enzyme [Gemmatimonadota bacterium]